MDFGVTTWLDRPFNVSSEEDSRRVKKTIHRGSFVSQHDSNNPLTSRVSYGTCASLTGGTAFFGWIILTHVLMSRVQKHGIPHSG